MGNALPTDLAGTVAEHMPPQPPDVRRAAVLAATNAFGSDVAAELAHGPICLPLHRLQGSLRGVTERRERTPTELVITAEQPVPWPIGTSIFANSMHGLERLTVIVHEEARPEDWLAGLLHDLRDLPRLRELHWRWHPLRPVALPAGVRNALPQTLELATLEVVGRHHGPGGAAAAPPAATPRTCRTSCSGTIHSCARRRGCG